MNLDLGQLDWLELYQEALKMQKLLLAIANSASQEELDNNVHKVDQYIYSLRKE